MGETTFISFIGYSIPAGNIPWHIKAVPPYRRLVSSGLCLLVGIWQGGIASAAPKSLLSQPY